MAVRHEVENLIRRGNIFYWRPPVPAAFTQRQPGSRLSLSLHPLSLHRSDHRKAQSIGWKLNMRLSVGDTSQLARNRSWRVGAASYSENGAVDPATLWLSPDPVSAR